MTLHLDLKDHVDEPQGGGEFTTLQKVAQDLHDLECMENELVAMGETIDETTGEKAFNLSLAIDVLMLVRGALSRCLCLMTNWAERLGESTQVEIDDTKRQFIQKIEVPKQEAKDIVPTSALVKGKN